MVRKFTSYVYAEDEGHAMIIREHWRHNPETAKQVLDSRFFSGRPTGYKLFQVLVAAKEIPEPNNPDQGGLSFLLENVDDASHG